MKIKTKDPIVRQVIAKLDERSQVGLEKYGESLEEDSRSLREWLIMLQEELLDGANYIQKLVDVLPESKTTYFEEVEELAASKGIVLDDDYMALARPGIPDGQYNLSHTTWGYIGKKYKADSTIYDRSEATTNNLGLVTIEDGEVDLREVFKLVPSMDREGFRDPHVFFEGFTKTDSGILISFGS